MESWFMLLQYGTLHGPTSTSRKRVILLALCVVPTPSRYTAQFLLLKQRNTAKLCEQSIMSRHQQPMWLIVGEFEFPWISNDVPGNRIFWEDYLTIENTVNIIECWSIVPSATLGFFMITQKHFLRPSSLVAKACQSNEHPELPIQAIQAFCILQQQSWLRPASVTIAFRVQNPSKSCLSQELQAV